MEGSNPENILSKRATILVLLSFMPAMLFFAANVPIFLSPITGDALALVIAFILMLIYLVFLPIGYKNLRSKPSLIRSGSMYIFGIFFSMFGWFHVVFLSLAFSRASYMGFSWNMGIMYILWGCLDILSGFIMKLDSIK